MQLEYKTLKYAASGWFTSGNVDEDEVNRTLNSLGREGWELNSGIPSSKIDGETHEIILFLKRPANAGR